MGYRDYYSTKRKTSIWSDNNALLMLIALNVFVYITLRFILAVYGLSNLQEGDFYRNIFQWFALPGDLKLFITRPWTLLSAGFTQMDLWMMISNMFWLWTFGFIFQDLTGNQRIIPLYIYGTLAAGVFFLAGLTIFPQLRMTANTSFYYGAMAPIIAVAMGATAFAPSYRLFPMIGGGIPLWVITAVFFLVDIFFLQQYPAWYLPHLAAAAMGVFFVQALKRGSDWGEWMNNLYYRLANLFTPRAKVPPRRPVKQEVFYNTRGHQPYKKTTNLTQQRIDEILDKISVKGYEKLTEEEKELLRRASEEDL